MKGAIMLSGGGSGKLFAAIGVTYPAGSTLTCTNGTKTLKAKNTSGQWVFAIPEAGTWTVKAVSGSNSKSQSVSITSEGQFESVTLSYQLVLFDGTLANGYSLDSCTVIPAIDVTNYSTLELYCKSNWTSSAAFSRKWGLSETLPEGIPTDFAASVNTATKEQTYTIDISALTGLYYFVADRELSISDNLLTSSAVSAGQGAYAGLSSVIFK